MTMFNNVVQHEFQHRVIVKNLIIIWFITRRRLKWNIVKFSNSSCKSTKRTFSWSLQKLEICHETKPRRESKEKCFNKNVIQVAECRWWWSSSISFYLYIKRKQVEFKGISGQIEFKEGQRNTFKLDLIKLKQNLFVKCGEWSNPSGLNITDYESLFEGNQMNTT